MIYERVSTQDPIRQGDIFRNIPRVEFSLSSLTVLGTDNELRQVTWRDALQETESPDAVAAVLPIKRVDALVITQDCDAARGEYIYLCQIDNYLVATGQNQPPKEAKAWQSLIMRMARTNPRLFYLPSDPEIGLPDRMAADFRVVLRVPRLDLLNMLDFRVARLNEVAAQHFREMFSQFFRRYAYNEWYPLDKEEFQAYANQIRGESVGPYPWQK